METTRRGFLTGIIGTSILGLLWPEKLKTKATQLLPAPLKEDTPHAPFTPLPDQQPHDPWAKVTEPLHPAPHESPGSFCPFNGQRYTQGQCPCALCKAARDEYWRDLEERAKRQQQFTTYDNGWRQQQIQNQYRTATASAGFGIPLWVTGGIAGSTIAPGTYPVSGTVTVSNTSGDSWTTDPIHYNAGPAPVSSGGDDNGND